MESRGVFLESLVRNGQEKVQELYLWVKMGYHKEAYQFICHGLHPSLPPDVEEENESDHRCHNLYSSVSI